MIDMTKIEKNIIFYFSGTGNSLKVAKDIASMLGDAVEIQATALRKSMNY
jgi:flavodoxin